MNNHSYRDRPKNLDLRTIRLPINALVSIMHRLSGCVLFLLIPIILFVLSQTLKSENDFDNLKIILASPKLKIIYLFYCGRFFIIFMQEFVTSQWIFILQAPLLRLFIQVELS